MKSISGEHLCRLLETRGWKRMHIHGSHHIYARSGSVVRISVPVHGNTPLKRGLQKHLMRLAEIDQSEL